MSSIAEPLQRDELHLFMAVLLHLAAGLLIYLLLVTGERQPHSVMLEGLPIVFGKMISPGEQGGDAPKSLAKSNPSEAQQAAADEATQASQTAAPKAEPVQRQSAGTVAATPPAARVARTAEPSVAQTEARPPATVALDSPPGPPPDAANVPTLRLQPDPEQAPREPPPAEAAAAAQQRTASAPSAEKAAEDAKAKLANVPGVKPAIVPQIDSRQRVVVPPKQAVREPEPVADPPVKIAEARRAGEAQKSAAAASAPTANKAQELTPPAETEAARSAPASTPPPKQTEPVTQAEAAKAKPPAGETAVATPPAASQTPAEPATPEDAAAVPQQTAQTPPAAAPPAQTAEAPAPEQRVAEAPVPEQRVADAPQQPAEATTAVPVPEQQASQPETVTQAQTQDESSGETQAAANEDFATPSTGGTPVPRQRAEEPERTDVATSGSGGQTAGSGGSAAGTGTGGGRTDALKAFGRLSGLGAGKSGVPSGTSATGGAHGQMQAKGSAIAQTCLEQRRVFKAGDRISTAFDVEMNRATKRLQVVQSSNRQLSRPRIAELEAALNGCAPFKDFLIAQPGLTRFSLAFASGRR